MGASDTGGAHTHLRFFHADLQRVLMRKIRQGRDRRRLPSVEWERHKAHLSHIFLLTSLRKEQQTVCMCAESLQSCLTLGDPMHYSSPAPLSMGFSKQEYCSGFPCPPPWVLPDPVIRPVSPVIPALQVDPFSLSHLGSP